MDLLSGQGAAARIAELEADVARREKAERQAEAADYALVLGVLERLASGDGFKNKNVQALLKHMRNLPAAHRKLVVRAARKATA